MSDETTRRALLKAAAGAGAAGSVGSAGCVTITTPADLASASEPSGNVEYFVGSSWLSENRDDVEVLDARPQRLFRRGRIYGARRVPLSAIAAQRSTEDGLVPDVGSIGEVFGELGVSPEDDIVVYGDSVGSRVTRTVFSLLACGHEGDVHILNGGFNAWNGRVGTGPASSPGTVSYEATPAEDLWVTKAWLADQLGADDGPGIVDVRLPEAFLAAAGSDALDPDQQRHGHIPGAVNVHWLGNIEGRTMADPGELFQVYGQRAELDQQGTVITYGDDNIDATQTWVILRAIGFEDVRVYDGGFTEWANVEDDHGRYPIETATDAVIDVDGEAGGEDGGDFTCS